MSELLSCAVGYFLGSIPFGLILCLLSGHGDIRKIGSGNIGATNVLRTGNKILTLATLALDSGKGAIAFLIINHFFGYEPALLAGFSAILGHLFPVWLYFKGGKGVATTFGTVLAASPIVGAGLCAIWLLVALTTRYSSLAALTALFISPFISYYTLHDELLAAFCSFVTVFVYFKHRTNIKRLLSGEETKIGRKNKHKET